ncbi:MAG: hypothetical protein AB7E79_15060 [Rhodospirillaceae bacterium]
MLRFALIPARGGSKRLPRKNLADFHGHPIMAYTIAAANKSEMFERVIVSTEDEEIAAVAEKYGAEVSMRPNDLASDTARVADVCADFLERERAAGRSHDAFAVLYATSPLRLASDIRATVSLLHPGVCDFALAATDYDMPPHQALRMNADQTLEPMWPDLVNKRADALGRLCVDNGSTYAVAVPAFLRQKSFYGPGLRAHLMPRIRSIDVDTIEDLDILRVLAAGTGLVPADPTHVYVKG